MRKAGADPFYPPIIEDEPAYLPSNAWAKCPPPPHHVQQDLLMAAEESGEYF